MALSITTNTLSLSTQRNLRAHDTEQARLIERLGSGMRINRAADDAAGQAITTRLTSNLRGASQAMRSLSDATSMLQVADGAMASVTDTLQRLRELAVAAGNGSYTDGDRGALQKEAQELLKHITQVGADTRFNGEQLFSQDTVSIGGDERRRAVLDGLQSGWLSSAEDMIKQHYGLMGDGAKLTVNLDTTDGAYNVLASVSGTTSGGKMSNLHLNLDMADFGSAATPDGGKSPQYSDRVIAHEMVHAVMASATSLDLSQHGWFTEGTAELIQGADERLAGDIAAAGGVANVVAGFQGTYKYSGGYAASRYMHDQLKGAGVTGGIKGVMQYLSANAGSDLDTALAAVSKGKYADVGAFESDFLANGVDYINTRMNLKNDDTGAIGGLDADGGALRSARAVVQDVAATSPDKPLRNFTVIMPENGGNTGVKRVQIQAGPRADDLIELQFSAMNATALGLSDLDMRNTGVALLRIDQAIDFVNGQRVVAGASSNRLDYVASNAQATTTNLETARDRIQDVDYASTTVKLTRAQILQQAASAMMTQANGEPRAVLALLR